MLPYSISPATTALVIVDLQKGYCAPDSDAAHSVMKWDTSPMEEICRRHIPFVEEARKILPATHIVWARMEEHEDTMAPNLPLTGDRDDYVRLCVRGTPGFDYHLVSPKEGEIEIFKTHYSTFHLGARAHTVGKPNKLVLPEVHVGKRFARPKHPHDLFKMLGVTTLAFSGVLESRCVFGSQLGGSIFGYKIITLSDLVGVPAGEAFAEESRVHASTRNRLYAPTVTGRAFLDALKH